MRSQVYIICETGHWAAGDEKLNVEVQAKVIALTNAYYKAETRAGKTQYQLKPQMLEQRQVLLINQ